MTKLFILLFFFVMFSCDFIIPTSATNEQKKQAMHNTSFDKNVIDNIANYKKLKVFLETNLDTIIKFRYSKNTAVLSNKPDSTYLINNYCYDFFQNNSRYDISNVPKFLKKQLDTLFHSFGEKNIYSFEICKDKKISITAKRTEGENNLSIYHKLLWNIKIEEYDTHYNKYIPIDKDGVYEIQVIEHL